MTTSQDFKDVFTSKFNLSNLGLWWTQSKGDSSEYDRRKFTVHIEIDRKDLPKREAIHTFFNQGKSVTSAFFGTPMILTRPFNYNMEDDMKATLSMHARKQFSMGKSLQSTTVYGINISNWSNAEKSSTLLEELIKVESIKEKTVIRGKATKKFFGRLFYAIIPNKKHKSVEFYYTKANSSEGSSVARAIPLFIRDFYKKAPEFYCDGTSIQAAMEGDWDFKTRKFLSADEKEELDRLDEMEDAALAEVEVFVSKDQQKAMALDEDDISEETRLTKGDKTPPPAQGSNEDVSTMTGDTRESKAQRYADSAVKEVASQYTSTITNMQYDISNKDDTIAELQRKLLQLQGITTTPPNSSSKSTPFATTANNHNSHNDGNCELENDSQQENNKQKDDEPVLHLDLTEETQDPDNDDQLSISSNSHQPNDDDNSTSSSDKMSDSSMSSNSSNEITNHERGSVKRTCEASQPLSPRRFTRARSNSQIINSTSTSMSEVDPDL